MCISGCISDAEFHNAINACLAEDPFFGWCESYGETSKYGVIADWDVSAVTDMSRAFISRDVVALLWGDLIPHECLFS